MYFIIYSKNIFILFKNNLLFLMIAFKILKIIMIRNNCFLVYLMWFIYWLFIKMYFIMYSKNILYYLKIMYYY